MHGRFDSSRFNPSAPEPRRTPNEFKHHEKREVVCGLGQVVPILTQGVLNAHDWKLRFESVQAVSSAPEPRRTPKEVEHHERGKILLGLGQVLHQLAAYLLRLLELPVAILDDVVGRQFRVVPAKAKRARKLVLAAISFSD